MRNGHQMGVLVSRPQASALYFQRPYYNKVITRVLPKCNSQGLGNHQTKQSPIISETVRITNRPAVSLMEALTQQRTWVPLSSTVYNWRMDGRMAVGGGSVTALRELLVPWDVVQTLSSV